MPPESIETWVKNGLMDPEMISKRFYKEVVFLTFTEEQHLEIRKKFNSYLSLSEVETYWDEAMFTKYLAENSQYSSILLLKEAAPILFSMMVYLSTFPLTIHKRISEPLTLAYEDLITAMHWLQPDPNDGLDRTKSPTDRRRYIFLSLADISGDFKYNQSEEMEISARKAFQVDDHSRNWACVNFDEKGDEMYHDVLDLISSDRMQYVQPPWGPYRKEEFVGLATHLISPTRLRQLAISRVRFKVLVKFLLAEYLNDGKAEISMNLQALDTSADSILNSFCYGTDADDIVTWPKFEYNLSENTPCLFTSILRQIENLKRDPDGISNNNYNTYSPENLLTGHILNLATMSQVLFSFGLSIGIEDLNLLFKYERISSSSTCPTIDHFMSLLKFKPEDHWDTKILFIAGTNASNSETVVFGALLRGRNEDEKILEDLDDNDDHRPALFQLIPYHDTFSGIYGKRAMCKTVSKNLCFGEQEMGFSMVLVEGMKTLKILHKITGGGFGSYGATLWRGDWGIEVEIIKVEVWELA
ncbi:hypothetical protein BGZ60DRAFT_559939 [Tricladium varicosporioides]|nr:hypothetical protein BGZ60DRAFT_559939 [Hymenoscyphus varicosporioides]